jgi:hypothetical protein
MLGKNVKNYFQSRGLGKQRAQNIRTNVGKVAVATAAAASAVAAAVAPGK